MSYTRSLYRQLLKEIHLQYTKAANSDMYANELRSIYRQNQSITDPATITSMNQTAADVVSFLKASRQHKELREKYSSVVLEQKKKIEMSANLVGLQLPEEYDPNSPKPLGGTEQAVADRVNKAFTNQ
ncbi:uncharacterized protein BX664DRAFT_378936 [Halteromyces radiatus]|uniref:uncharacterized protein n=1 Tax=Halteromyces radiatus TaxID=101107 RepID=UPI00221F7D78|nr:uncharacterized protein BX664DRAFT_378936 [Halteromyces radiatus]KAI8093671.1 hypothetical protein BX664DRAFT_378936 [Halteromyces radiatus]